MPSPVSGRQPPSIIRPSRLSSMTLTQTSSQPGLARRHVQVPITALAIHENYLLAAQDTWLVVYDTTDSSVVCRRNPSVFATVNGGQPIHGLCVDQRTSAVLLWGASAVAYLPDGWQGTAEVSGSASDWIYAGVISPYEDGKGVLVTAHNDVIAFDATDGSRLLQFGEEISPSRPILYSATVQFLSAGTLLVAGGTVFGEIIVWGCQLPSVGSGPGSGKAQTYFVLEGHEGSIFGVEISPPLGSDGRRVLASCSDDRTIRLWDISEKETYEENNLHAARETGFITSPTTMNHPFASAMGHASRIWGVRMACDSEELALYSFGEDATMQRWRVDAQKGHLEHVQTFSYHDGKHLWAHALASAPDRSLVLATGGADSKISLLKEPGVTEKREELKTVDIKDVASAAGQTDRPRKRAKEIITRYDFLSADEILAMTSSGRVLRGLIHEPASSWCVEHVEETMAGDLELCYALTRVGPGAIVLGTTSGNIYFYGTSRGLSHVTKLDGRVMDLVAVHIRAPTNATADVFVQLQSNMCPYYLTIDLSSGDLIRRTQLLQLDPRFVAVSACRTRSHVFIGSRHGWLAAFETKDADLDLLANVQTRSTDAISSIIEIPPTSVSDVNPLYILTTSRDSHYRIYELREKAQLPDADVLELVHETSAPFGPTLLGAYFTADEKPELIIHGFRGKEFVVWNETRRSEITTVYCGGAHRMHCLWNDPLVTNRIRFAFTKASQLFIHQQEGISHSIIAGGTHGREIRALASSGRVIATGAEDTTIRLWEYGADIEGIPEMRTLATMKAHNTGLQRLKWLGDDYLFSSAGFEEFFVWRVRKLDASYQGLAVVREASFEDKSPDGDLRIMDFDVFREDGDSAILITLAFSNSSIGTYRYSREEGFVLQAKGLYTGACITQVRHLRVATDHMLLLTASTDGHICAWKAGITGQEAQDYRLAEFVRAHQSGVKALDMIACATGHLIFTGGDDNTVCSTLVATKEVTDDPTAKNLLCKPLGCKQAHAASINGVVLVEREQQVVAVSVSNDERTKLWRLDIEGERPPYLLRNEYSGVADPGDVGKLTDGKVILGGVGLEIWDLGV